jgi:sulfate adenylyltransferase
MASEGRQAELAEASRDWPSWDLLPRQVCDVELLLSGAYSPLSGPMTQADYDAVCDGLRLADGTCWPLPLTLDISEQAAEGLEPGGTLALRDLEGVMLAVLEVEQLWRPDLQREAELVYGTGDRSHPGVRRLLERTHPVYVGGKLEGMQLPQHYDFRLLRHTPQEARQAFTRRGWRRILSFQTRSPMHRVHVRSTFQAAGANQTNLFIQPVVGEADTADAEHYTRVRSYQAVFNRYPKHTAMLGLLHHYPRHAGPREALLQGIMARNHGCTHVVVGPQQASPNGDAPPYEPYAAQELFAQHQEQLGIQMVPVRELVYVNELGESIPDDQVPEGASVTRFSERDVRRRLMAGRSVPEWFSYPEVLEELKRSYPPRHRQGFTVFFTGLSGAGKSTVANVLLVKLMELGGRPVTLLDGDIVRKNLSSELTFSREHRDINIRRIGFVAAEITKNGGIAICAPIAPYDSVRKAVRQEIARVGGFILVHVATPLSVCEQRDRKGMYAKARAGIIKNFTGISDPFEVPQDAQVELDTSDITPIEAAQQLLLYLEKEGYLAIREDNGGA